MELKYYNKTFANFAAGLLIVPYGIEIRKKKQNLSRRRTFNCTLWN